MEKRLDSSISMVENNPGNSRVLYKTHYYKMTEKRVQQPGKEVCYERVGCFKDGFPWTGTLSRQLAGLPWSPEEINTRFLLYTRHNPKAYQEISAVLLKVEDVNCINVDWINGSLEYIHAVNNLRVVGAEVAYLTDVLMRLDPAGPYFHNTPNEVRLDPSDANFVDVIHTNAVRLLFEFGAGTINACGHLDFYPNGGKHMPGCEDLITPLFSFDFNAYKEEKWLPSLIATMPEVIAFILKASSILMHLLLILVDPTDLLKRGNCFHCPKEGCPTMGHFADRFHLKNTQPNRSYYFLNTGTLSPFARWSHKLSVRLDGNNVTQGSMFLRVGGTTGKTGALVIASGALKPGMTYTKLIDADVNVGNVTSIEFFWKELLFGHSQNKLGAEMVIDISGKYGYESTFCSQDIMGPNIAQILKPCQSPIQS
ncbi:pancreatic lipase-related protein 3 isoform X1 [Prionailurus iriomotensis]